MLVNNHIIYHYHTNGIYDELWQEGKEVVVDDTFNSYFCKIIKLYSSGFLCKDDCLTSLDKIIKHYLKQESIDESVTRRLLEDSAKLIYQSNIAHREQTLEMYREKYYSKLPSRLHSIWLCDQNGLNYWKGQLNDNTSLFELSVTGELFKSHDDFIPRSELTILDMYKEAENYWNPKFTEELDKEKYEYLFQGKAKVLKRM